MKAFSQLSINIEITRSCKGRLRFNCTKRGQKPRESTIQAKTWITYNSSKNCNQKPRIQNNQEIFLVDQEQFFCPKEMKIIGSGSDKIASHIFWWRRVWILKRHSDSKETYRRKKSTTVDPALESKQLPHLFTSALVTKTVKDHSHQYLTTWHQLSGIVYSKLI